MALERNKPAESHEKLEQDQTEQRPEKHEYLSSIAEEITTFNDYEGQEYPVVSNGTNKLLEYGNMSSPDTSEARDITRSDYSEDDYTSEDDLQGDNKLLDERRRELLAKVQKFSSNPYALSESVAALAAARSHVMGLQQELTIGDPESESEQEEQTG